MSALPRGLSLPARLEPRELSPVDRAILSTLIYAGLFHAPLTLAQLHRGLIGVRLEPEALRRRLRALRRRVSVKDGLVLPRGAEHWLGPWRERGRHSRLLLERHRRVLELLTRFPFVRLVALSGACAHENATDDDVDVFLVTSAGRAWAVSLAVVLLSRLLRVRRSLCVNYVLDEAALALPERDLFTATEVVGLRVVAGRAAYRRFVQANEWIAACYPNFFALHREESEASPETRAPRWLERVLELGPAALFEGLARRVLGRHLRRKARDRAGVVLESHRLKLHLADHRPRLNAAFAHALRAAGVDGGETAGAP